MAVEKSTAQEFLSQAHRCETDIHNLLAKKARLESLREKTTTTWGTERVSGTMNNDKLCDTTAKIMELDQEYDAEIEKLKARIKEIDDVIHQVTNQNYYEVLSRVYIRYESLKQAADSMYLGERHVRRIHKRALQVVESILAGN
jgi:DNA-directed RNA polymerase specialized sigma subunit